jgi:hypothetical protein
MTSLAMMQPYCWPSGTVGAPALLASLPSSARSQLLRRLLLPPPPPPSRGRCRRRASSSSNDSRQSR